MSDAPAAPDLRVKQIEAGDKLTGLSLGEKEYAPLKAFVQKKALSYEQQSLARTYAVFVGTDLKAYITLVCGEVQINEGDPAPIEADDFDYLHYPAVKIARLAVDRRLKRSGIGRQLVELALGVAHDSVCPAVGCRFMMVDAKRSSVDFYLKCGFTILDTAVNRERASPVMFLDLGRTAPEE